ncbi:unnamed protein product [Orchesella dallaii]|uniref:Polyketide synthase-nonribosomal peptide synthetase n=1 Tax=Orchesella dallaii TaxID=48710 RepID=A0ABP1Q0V3_9HEXA
MKYSSDQIWLTSALADSDVHGALTLGYSLRRVFTCRKLGVIISPNVSKVLRRALNYCFDFVFYLDEELNTVGLENEEFVKVFALTLKSFQKVVMFSPTMLVVKNCDELLDSVGDDTKQPFMWTKEGDNSTLILYPSLRNFDGVMKGLSGRNGTPMEVYLRKWLHNQVPNCKFIEDKYNQLVHPQTGLLRGNENEVSIVNLRDSLEKWLKASNKSVGFIGQSGAPAQHQLNNAKSWLLFQPAVDKSQVCPFLKERLERSSGRKGITVQAGNKFELKNQNGNLSFTIRKEEEQDFITLMEALKSEQINLEGIVYAWSLESWDGIPTQDEVLRPYFFLTKTLLNTRFSGSPRLIGLTHGVIPVGDLDMSNFVTSTIWGYTKSLKNENHGMCVKFLDVESGSLNEKQLEEIFSEIWNVDKDIALAYRNGTKFVGKMQAHKVSANSSDQIWLTSALADSDVHGALTLGYSLRRVFTCRKLGVIISPNVSKVLRRALNYCFDFVFYLDEELNTVGLENEEFVKVFALTLKSFQKVVMFSPTMLVVKNCDELLDSVGDDTKQPFMWTKEGDNSTLILYPSLRNFDGVMKGLSGRNGTPMEVYLRNWLHNQVPNCKYIEDKYNQLVHPQTGLLRSNQHDISVANLRDSLEQWLKASNKPAGFIGQHRVDSFRIRGNYQQLNLLQDDFNIPSSHITDLFGQVEKLVYLNMLRCLYECGWKPVLKETFSEQVLYTQLQIISSNRQYFGFMLEVLGMERLLEIVNKSNPADITWRLIRIPPTLEEVERTLSSPAFTSDLVSRYSTTPLLTKVGENLSKIMIGTQPALNILFPEQNEGYPSVGEFYMTYQSIFRMKECMVSKATHKLAHTKNVMQDEKYVLRLLEIGAGTGSFTENALNALETTGSEFEYTYTDISAAFFPAAEKKFEKYAKHMKFKKLNIEEDPFEQGFTPEYYDHVCASDVIHATKDIAATLKNIRILMRPNGMLELQEMTKVHRFTTFLFGLLEGFWRFEDLELRPRHCTLSSQDWSKVLASTGFEVDGIFPMLNNYHSYIWGVKSRAPAQHQLSNAKNPKNAKNWLLFQPAVDKSQVCPFLKVRLERSSGRKGITVQAGNKFELKNQNGNLSFTIRKEEEQDFITLMEALKSEQINLEGIVYAWSLESWDGIPTQDEVLRPYFFLTKALVNTRFSVSPRLIGLTHGVIPVGDVDMSNFATSTLWGYTKTLKNENHGMSIKFLDIESGPLYGKQLEEIFYEIWNIDKDLALAYRNGTKFVGKMQAHKGRDMDTRIGKESTGTANKRLRTERSAQWVHSQSLFQEAEAFKGFGAHLTKANS